MTKPNPRWPVLTRYAGRRLDRLALPLGGIGTGTVSLGGRGDLRDWEVVNRPAKGFAPRHTFLALRVAKPGAEPVARALEGAIPPPFEGPHGATTPNHGLPRFRRSEFLAAYPFGQVLLADPAVPVDVRLDAFNPLVPADPDASGIPVAFLTVAVTNPTADALEVSVCANLENFVGHDGTNGRPDRNRNTYRRVDGLAGLLLDSAGVEPTSEQWGSVALVCLPAGEVTHRTDWKRLSWGDSLLDFWDDFLADGRLDDRAAADASPDGAGGPIASLCEARTLPAGDTALFRFLLAWHFPNRRAWATTARGGVNGFGEAIVGNHYATRFADAWEAARHAADRAEELERETLGFVSAFCGSDLPGEVKEASLYNLSTLRSQTCFRTADGWFYGWEGCNDATGSCLGSCTHVWNYEQATAFLFGSLARSMREVEFLHATRDDGHMSFRVLLPLARAQEWGLAAADGQMGCLMKLYREWQLSGDDGFLRRLWPKARKALAFCWIPGGWDADRDGVMEGCQHNTMDVEYYGPNPQMGIWYLGALRAAEEMARHLGDDGFATECRGLFERGRAWLDEHLFNGEYYEQQIRPPGHASVIAPGLRHGDMGARDLEAPELQLGSGCLVDQLVGQYMAHVVGLGDLVDPVHARATLAAIKRHNFRRDLHGHFNHMRSFALEDEAALLMASFPRGRRPTRPFPYFNEVMTGFEYTAAVHMLYEGMVDDGLEVVAAIRRRYDGERRSPFNEAECGHHYARAMASWAAVLAMTGFRYSGVTETLGVRATPGPATAFWSTGDAWGTLRQTPGAAHTAVELAVRGGVLRLRRLDLAGLGALDLAPTTLGAGDVVQLVVPPTGPAEERAAVAAAAPPAPSALA